MLTKETFIKAITAIRKHEELMDRLDAICREFGDFRPCLDFGNLHLQALLDVLKEAMNDQNDYNKGLEQIGVSGMKLLESHEQSGLINRKTATLPKYDPRKKDLPKRSDYIGAIAWLRAVQACIGELSCMLSMML